ncbi:MAG: pyruvate, phosphate dikinase [Bacteroidales bacterium]|nr:pyruvate, phosphate dikinase [Bacteroidales bacterium]MBN2697317.1 pyruvate, phosphate dikinase [Bacteroidales bacterium]
MDPIPSSEEYIQKLIAERKERLKELNCINQTTQIIKESSSVEHTLSQIVMILPAAWQYQEMTVARIWFEGREYASPGFRESKWKQSQKFVTINNQKGSIEIYYLKEFAEADEGPFLKEERQLIDNIASIISNYLNSLEAKKILKKSLDESIVRAEVRDFKKPEEIDTKRLLQKFINKQNANRDIFHDLMPYRVREILLVATLYDAYSIEKEGRFSEHILGEYHQLSLTSMPRVTGVSSYEEAMEQLNSRHFDLVILMFGNDKVTPLNIARKVREDFPYIPVYVLVNNDREVNAFKENNLTLNRIVDRLFVWNGDSRVFFAMVKHLEDSVNVESDTRLGLVKVILLVEDSEIYYSRYLPLLYSNVIEQTSRIVEDPGTDEIFKILRLRARPKILLANNYEEAIDVVKKYKDYLLCLITDIEFNREGKMDPDAGFRLVNEVRKIADDLPTIIQSADVQNSHRAYELKSTFINKNSETLLQDIRNFIMYHLGFGSFIYRDSSGKKIAEAKSLQEFEKMIASIPSESLVYHGRRNHFSLWLTARGEIRIAKLIHPIKVTDFKTPDEFRNYLRYIIKKYRNESNTGRIVNFEESALLDESNIVSLGTGALGGKGRGCAFINTLIYNMNFQEIIPDLNIRTPRTSIIGTDEFDLFIERNNLHDIAQREIDYNGIRQLFLESDLSYNLEKRLRELVKKIDQPLAVRSSSLMEDSTMQPFSGIFDTYLVPNNHPEFNVRFRQLCDAVKLVYASVYSPHSKGYFKAIRHNIEEEKMAVVIQNVVGRIHDDYFYPHVSGTAQSHNFYPIAYVEPEDGFALAALGLGHYVVNGEKSYIFSPKYPELEINSPAVLFRDSQVEFLALDLKNTAMDFCGKGTEANLARLTLADAENHGTLKHLASVYDAENNRIDPGLSSAGPRILNFADILKYGYTPLAHALRLVLDVGQQALGSPIEIEYALDLDKSENGKPSIYLLQIKPMLGSDAVFSFEMDSINQEDLIILAEKSMGNGRIDDLTDIVYVIPEIFDKLRTRMIAREIEEFNAGLVQQGRQYVLIGPGRWGTKDPLIGLPVNWSQISHARVIIETSLENFPLDASLGSHFFHNVTSMNVGYFSIQHQSGSSFIRWDVLGRQKVVKETEFVKHIRFDEPLCILMNGRKRISVVMRKPCGVTKQ